jgi:hypothetical protein
MHALNEVLHESHDDSDWLWEESMSPHVTRVSGSTKRLNPGHNFEEVRKGIWSMKASCNELDPRGNMRMMRSISVQSRIFLQLSPGTNKPASQAVCYGRGSSDSSASSFKGRCEKVSPTQC